MPEILLLFIKYLSPDSSIFYTIGRSMANGTVVYKEIADHKGFYLLFLKGNIYEGKNGKREYFVE